MAGATRNARMMSDTLAEQELQMIKQATNTVQQTSNDDQGFPSINRGYNRYSAPTS